MAIRARRLRQGFGKLGTALELERFEGPAHRASEGAVLFRLIALLFFAVFATLPMQASVTHNVKFGQGPIVLVWQDGALVGRGEAVALEGEPAPAPQADWVGGGVLEPVSFATEPQKARVETVTIASNAPLALWFEGQPRDGRVEVRLLSIGSAAQYQGPRTIERDYTLDSDLNVLTIPVRTAANPGPVVAQTLTFEIERTGDAAMQAMVFEALE